VQLIPPLVIEAPTTTTSVPQMDTLPATGAHTWVPAALAAACLLSGMLLLVLSRRGAWRH
jgi:LPXTG-motif cell wall-anchored protein